ncbi:uncharacterized protein K460DRAFT_416553 [Cucurbitaria berberidis CBS 394.84]|uniref:Uncharacterized protein n=1 Tax=Cucurbitaria berberidis CBS 394.84 TaxID=1168544 RepID=A0A9P4L8E9_9PLEO|nr:uncharacterized protein K460DRAFT_416553 [Cucurbitaria berberidis CBS 394.84]KAF1845272.1 hypothetical protein K460DRAFT_416553 [Cucurbitaria berberidis CBS 394.84]
MAPSSPHKPSDPLLGGQPKLNNEPSSPPLSPATQTAIKALTLIRIVTGAACLVAPRFTCALFKYPVPAEQALLVRMFGVRDAMFGALLITAEDKAAQDGGKREMRRAIWAGIATDVVDMGSLALGVAMGQVGKTAAGLLGAGAVGAVGLGAIALRGL